MCPTLDELGIIFTYFPSGNCRVEGPIQHVRLNIKGAEMATLYGRMQGEEFFLGQRITSVWGYLVPGLVTLVVGDNTYLNVDTTRDNWFLDLEH